MLQAGHPTPFTFRILDRTGQPVPSFVEQHEPAMHLIVIRRDLSGFQHLHPTMQVDGTWTAGMTLPTPGVWRALADFATDGGAVTLGADLFLAGQFDPVDLPAPDHSTNADGYEVRIQPAELAGGGRTELAFQVAPRRAAGDRPGTLPRRPRPPGRAARAQISGCCTCTPPTPRPGCLDQLQRRLAQRWPLPALPAVPASGRGPDRRSDTDD